jgi:hypothetical protein
MTPQEVTEQLDFDYKATKAVRELVRDQQRQIDSLKKANKWHQEQKAKAEQNLMEVLRQAQFAGFKIFQNGKQVIV